ncbi:MAG: DUF3090 family protein [Dehalococcoidia bacterium]|nr:DUF3090 family protein [Dehalococcoidia bacterium]
MTIDLGSARSIEAESFGQPGQRTFRLRVMSAALASASLWLEKEHLQALGMALTQLLAQLGREPEAEGLALDEFPEVADYDFHVGRMAIGFDPADQSVVLQTFDAATEDDDDPTLMVRVPQEQCPALNAQLRRIVGAGRPVCPLCGLSIDASGHACVRANGHSSQAVPDRGAEEEE